RADLPDTPVDVPAPVPAVPGRDLRAAAHAEPEFDRRLPFVGADIGAMPLSVTGHDLAFERAVPGIRTHAARCRIGAGALATGRARGQADEENRQIPVHPVYPHSPIRKIMRRWTTTCARIPRTSPGAASLHRPRGTNRVRPAIVTSPGDA